MWKWKELFKKIFKGERESWYNNVQCRQRERFECRSFHEVLYRWQDDDLEQSYEILFRIQEFFKERGRDVDAREKAEKKIQKRRRASRKRRRKKQISEFLFFVWHLYK